MPRRKRKDIDSVASNNISLWQKNIPILYNFLFQEKLACPSYACAVGDTVCTSHHSNNEFTKHRIYQSQATNANYLKDQHVWQGQPHALLVYDVHVPNTRTRYPALDQQLNDWHTNNRSHGQKGDVVSYPTTRHNNGNDDDSNCSYVCAVKKIIHPGPISRIKQMPRLPHICATHTQHKYVFIWNTQTQHDRQLLDNSDPNTPELILKGHQEDAVYALDFSTSDFGVASGGQDNRICVWNVADYQTVLSSSNEPDPDELFVPFSKPSPKLKPRIILKGHQGEVTDVAFAPHSPYLIASVSNDKSFKLWDLRCNAHDMYAAASASDSESMHEIDNDCCVATLDYCSELSHVAWNAHRSHHILTAAKDGTIQLLDSRKLPQQTSNSNSRSHLVVQTFKGHSAQISSLQWNPCKEYAHYFLSASQDGTCTIWDSHKESNHVVFKHVGHMNHEHGAEVVHNASWMDSMCVLSTSSPKPLVPFCWENSNNHTNSNHHGVLDSGIMHIWRPNLLLTHTSNEIIQHLTLQKGIKIIDDLTEKPPPKKKIKTCHKQETNTIHAWDIPHPEPSK